VVDKEEDKLYKDKGGNELPPELNTKKKLRDKNMKRVYIVIAVQSNNEIPPGNNDTGQAVEKPVRYMFVQSAHSGSFVPVEGEKNFYTLALEGVSPQTIAFLDRPERVVGQEPMQKSLDGLGFSPENPPNAAIEITQESPINSHEDQQYILKHGDFYLRWWVFHLYS
jgi:hypothetical protein